jgi:hypothetical protein
MVEDSVVAGFATEPSRFRLSSIAQPADLVDEPQTIVHAEMHPIVQFRRQTVKIVPGNGFVFVYRHVTSPP